MSSGGRYVSRATNVPANTDYPRPPRFSGRVHYCLMSKGKVALGLPIAALAGLATHDLLQRRHSLLRAFPVIGHARYFIEKVGPEMRQYVVAGNDEERPFSRDQRTYIYRAAKGLNTYVGFGTDNNIEFIEGYPIVKHRTFVADPPTHHSGDAWVPSAKILGGPRGRRFAFRPNSVVNVSAMSYGSLSGAAIRAVNGGAKKAGCLHNTGEGALSPHHQQGGDLTFQIGTSYFGCRDDEGRFDLDKLLTVVQSNPVRSIEIKLSQGAKPGLGGVLPGSKVTEQIAATRGIPAGKDCISPSRHTAFHDVDSMLDFVETVADATGLPVGIKSAVGHLDFWEQLAEAMLDGSRGVDFITVDGGEGGTGAAPLVFSDHVSLPFRAGFAQVYGIFAQAGITDRLTFIGSGKLGVAENAVIAFALGADMVNIAREAMIAIGCLQTQKCHTDHCPTGIATQNRWLERGVDVPLKSDRLGNYIISLRRDLLKIAEATGVAHPALVSVGDIDMMFTNTDARPLADVVGYQSEWGQPAAADMAEITALMRQASNP